MTDPLDHDGDGRKGGSLPRKRGRPVKAIDGTEPHETPAERRLRNMTVQESQAFRTSIERREAEKQALAEAHIEAYLQAGTVRLVVLQDGVFPFADIRKDKGDECVASEEVAALLIERGHARRY